MATSDQAGMRWRTSSYSTGGGNDGDCVEVAYPGATVAVRDSKSPTTGTLVLPPAAWRHFLGKVASPSA
jgi:hypothetical protein